MSTTDDTHRRPDPAGHHYRRACVHAARVWRDDGDIDLLVTFAEPTSLFRQIELKDELARIAERKVDLMTQIDPAFAPYIVPTLVSIPIEPRK